MASQKYGFWPGLMEPFARNTPGSSSREMWSQRYLALAEVQRNGLRYTADFSRYPRNVAVADPRIVTARVDREDVIAYLSFRSKQEIIICPRNIEVTGDEPAPDLVLRPAAAVSTDVNTAKRTYPTVRLPHEL